MIWVHVVVAFSGSFRFCNTQVRFDSLSLRMTTENRMRTDRLNCTTKKKQRTTSNKSILLKSIRLPIRIQLPTLRLLLGSFGTSLNNGRLITSVEILYSTSEEITLSLLGSTTGEIGESFRAGMLHLEILHSGSCIIDGFNVGY